MFILKNNKDDAGEVKQRFLASPASFAENYSKKYEKEISKADLLTTLEGFYVYMARGNDFTIKSIFNKI